MNIDDSQRDTIVAQLRRKGKWTCRRAGHTIRIWKRITPNGLRVCWQITRPHVNISASNCPSVKVAIAAINDALDVVTDKLPVPAPEHALVGSLPPVPSSYRLPYADN